MFFRFKAGLKIELEGLIMPRRSARDHRLQRFKSEIEIFKIILRGLLSKLSALPMPCRPTLFEEMVNLMLLN
ncbi:MAG: hypothetical protein WBM02_04455 [bacterium]